MLDRNSVMTKFLVRIIDWFAWIGECITPGSKTRRRKQPAKDETL